MTVPTPKKPLRDVFRSSGRYAVMASIAAVVLVVAILLWIVTVLHPMPPRVVVMTTGSEGGAYYEFGKRYREILAQSGIELRLMPSAGGIENLRRLRDPHSGVSIGFVQGGTGGEREPPVLVSLGTVFYEPLWIFCRGAHPIRKLEDLRGKRISVGPEGSGTRFLATELLRRSGIDQGIAEFLPLPLPVAAEKLLAGEIEAAFIVTSWDSPVVQRLAASEDVGIAGFSRADAYVALYPYLNKVVVPAGLGNLVRNRPAADTVLLAPETSLVVRKELHPAIQYLLLDAATQIHSPPGAFRKAGQFPAAASAELPLSEHARQFYKSGRPFLQRYFPFWFAVLLGQLLVLLIPVIGALYPLARFLPALYAYGMRRRIFRLYGELKYLDAELKRRGPGEERGDLLTRLDRFEECANRLHVPMFYTHMMYELRRDIRLVRGRLEDT